MNDETYNLIFQNLEYEYIREDLGYGTIDLLCDVGGTLSLLMGASLLTCCELLEVAWLILVKKCCRKVSKSISSSTRRKSGKRPSKKNRQSTMTDAANSLDMAAETMPTVIHTKV